MSGSVPPYSCDESVRRGKIRYTFIFNPGFKLCTTSCGLWSSFASNDRTTPLGMNRRYRWYVIKCVMLTHAFSLWPVRTSALGVGIESREAPNGIRPTMTHRNVDSVNANARLLDEHSPTVTVVCF